MKLAPPTTSPAAQTDEKRHLVFDSQLGKMRPVGMDQTRRLSSSSLGWSGYHLEEHHVPHLEVRDVVWLTHAVFLQLRAPVRLEVKQDSQITIAEIQPGEISIIPAATETTACASGPVEFMFLAVEPWFLAEAIGRRENAGEVKLKLEYGKKDSFIEAVCLALQREVANGGEAGRLYSDSLAASLAVHLASRYGNAQSKLKPALPSAAPGVVRQAIEFIQTHDRRDLSLADIAAAVQLSPFHFSRLFKRTVGISPYQFVLRQRIERAKRMILAGQMPVASIAVEVGFYDQSHFIHHFKRLCQMTPKQFRDRAKT